MYLRSGIDGQAAWLLVLLVNFDFVPCFITRVADSFEGLRRGGRLAFFGFSPFFLFFGLASLESVRVISTARLNMSP